MSNAHGGIVAQVLAEQFGFERVEAVSASPVMVYLAHKTRAAGTARAARPGLANLYALAELCLHYQAWCSTNPPGNTDYSSSPGARMSALLAALRERPFGTRLQNHALNHRLNEEFARVANTDVLPVTRRQQLYWLNLDVVCHGQVDLTEAIIAIVERYVVALCATTAALCCDLDQGENRRERFQQMLGADSDERMFEIGAYAVLAVVVGKTTWIAGIDEHNLQRTDGRLIRMGRTNANDGGIDMLELPSGRAYQVSRTARVDKVALDVAKLGAMPVTFVVNTSQTPKEAAAALSVPDRMDVLTRPALLAKLEELDDIEVAKAAQLALVELERELGSFMEPVQQTPAPASGRNVDPPDLLTV